MKRAKIQGAQPSSLGAKAGARLENRSGVYICVAYAYYSRRIVGGGYERSVY